MQPSSRSIAGQTDFDACVVGAGAIGLACAHALASAGQTVLVLERHESFGRETSSRNSQVVHAGMYYPPGTLKARLCVPGRRSLLDWCRTHQVSHRLIGKYIVAVTTEEDEQLEAIRARADENGVEALDRVPANVVHDAEPNVVCVGALWSPNTAIVDSHELMQSLHAAAASLGCSFGWRHQLKGADGIGGGYALTVADASGLETSVRVARVVNAAGLEADRVAGLLGLDIEALGYRQSYYKGSYFFVHPRRRELVRHLVYPVPLPGLSGLGIHATIDTHGQLRLGPDVEAVDRAQFSYAVDPTRRSIFHQAASRYLRGLELEDLSPDQAGVRPRCTAMTPTDFLIRDEASRGFPGWINLLGIESPGLTCCLEIAKMVSERCE
jgi:L-2-hydroxyglutarate oxidase LhgO